MLGDPNGVLPEPEPPPAPAADADEAEAERVDPSEAETAEPPAVAENTEAAPQSSEAH